MTGARSGHLWLIGLMGSGKSTVGRLLAGRIGRPFVDLDAEVEAKCGCTVAALFARRGEPAFRGEESATLRRVAGYDPPAVVATGGGVVLDAGNRTVMRGSGTVIWLRAEVPTLVGRVSGDVGRPLLGQDAQQALRRLAAERSSIYQTTAHTAVDVDDNHPDAVVDQILGVLGWSAPLATRTHLPIRKGLPCES